MPVSSLLQLARGAAAAGVLGASALALALLIGLTPGTSIALFPGAALAAVVFTLIPNREVAPQVVGAALVGLAALGMGLATGFGMLETCGLIGSVLAALLVGGVVPVPRRLPVAALALVALGLVVVNLAPLILDGGGLGHDESAYALKARHWAEGTPETGWSLHRGVAMSGYGYLMLVAGGEEAALRLLGLVALLGLAAAAWWLGAQIGGPVVGPLSAVAVASSPALVSRSTEYLSDIPSSALLVACMVVVWREFGQRERPTLRLLWVLPLAWAAFYLRYQSVLSFALIAVTIAVLFRDELRAGWRVVAGTAALGVAGLIPHFVYAIAETGSPLGILLVTADVAGREYYGEGLVDYTLLMGWRLAAFLGPLAVVFFVWWAVTAWRQGEERTRSLFLMIPAAGQVLALGILSHGEARFVFFPLTLTLIGGITGAIYVAGRWRSATSRALYFGLVVLLVGSLGLAAAYARRAVDNRTLSTEPIELAGEQIRQFSGDVSCGVMTSYLPQITYYSECYTAPFRLNLEPDEALDRLTGEERFMLLIEDGKRQPAGDDLNGLIALTDSGPFLIDGERDSAEIYGFGDG